MVRRMSEGKCEMCSAILYCLLTERMRGRCEGPFESREAHINSLRKCIRKGEVRRWQRTQRC